MVGSAGFWTAPRRRPFANACGSGPAAKSGAEAPHSKFVLLILALLICVSAGVAQKPDAKQQKPKDPFAGFHWVEAGKQNRGVVFEGRTLTPLTLDARAEVPSDTQTEVTRPDANTMRIVRRTYNRDVNGRTKVVELVTEDVRATANNGFSATRSVSRPDTNGRMLQVEKATQETVAAGADTYRTQSTLARGSGALSQTEQVVQIEKKKADGTVEIDKTAYRPNSSGSLAAAERHVSSSRQTANQTSGQEDVYRQDVNGAMALLRREVNRESKDAQGNPRGEIETHLVDSTGRLQLNGRAVIASTTYADGSQQVTQTTSQVNPAAPGRGLQVSEKVVQTMRPAGANATETEIQVQKPDVNGALQTIAVQHITEKK